MGINSQLFDYLDADDDDKIDIYFNMIDGTLIQLIKNVAHYNIGEASELANRFLKRDLYKCYELSAIAEKSWSPGTKAYFERELNEKNIWFRYDSIPEKGHKQHSPRSKDYLKNILIGDGTELNTQPIYKLSKEIEQYGGYSPIRYYFKNSEERIKAVKIYRAIPID